MDSTSADEPVHRDEQQQMQRIKPNDNVVVNRNSNKRSDALKVCRGNLVSKGGEKLNLNTFREAASHESFLETLFELFDEDGDGLIDQDDFIMSFHQQLKDEKGKQFCEVLETATFAIAHEQLIRLPIFLSIFSTRRLLDKLFIVMDKDGDNLVSINEAMDFIAKLTIAQTPTSLTKENLDYLKDLFINHCNENHEITLENFRKIIKSKNVFFTERVFHIFDRDGSGTVSLQEFLDAVGKFSGQSMDNKIKFLFDIYDQDGDGRVQMCELRQVIKACMDENGMAFSEEQLDDLTTALFEDADPNNTGAITVEALKAQLEKHEGMVENLSYSIEKWLVPPRPEVKTFAQEVKASVPHQLSWGYMKNNHVFLVFFFAFIALNIALFISRMWQYRNNNEWVMVARGCGQCLNFTCMFILVLMLRKSITWLRSQGVSSILPLDEHIYLHKLTGYLIFVYSFGHTIAHIGNLVVLAKEQDDDDVVEFVIECLFTTKTKIGWVYGTAFPTGVALLVILVVMVICSQNFVRKGGKFEVFYWTHRLYIAFFILCFLHGPRFWHWFIVPCIIFIIEMAIRFRQRRTGYGRTNITEAVLLPSKVTHLVIKRPPNFHFRAGDYVFIKIPSIAKYEWHPFTLSSAPEQSDVVWLHIRGVGEWTNQLYGHINKQFQAIMAAQNPPAVEQATPKQSIFARGSRYLKRKTTLQINGENGDTLGLSSNPQGYQPMGSPLTNSTESIEIDTKTSNQLKLPDKQKVIPVKSLPIFEKNVIADEHKGLSRSRSHRIDSTGSYSPIPGSSTVCVRTRSRGQSFKHMRRKPKVLPMPGLSTAIIHEEEGETSEGVLDTVVISAEPSAQLTTVTTNNDELETVTLHIPAKPDNEVELRERVPTLATAGSRTSFVCYDPASEAKPLEVIIDGPYGAPSSHIFRAEHAVLVGTGIGVTPFASILQSIMRRYWEARLGCPKCHYTWTNKLPESYLNLRKVDFFWINRDQKSFEWFVNLLSELEIEQAEQGGAMERFLDMHMYITTALQKTDMKAVGLHLALDLLHEKEKRDMITGLKTRTHPGRPNWNKVFRQIANQKKGRVTVFFCGPPQLARSLKLKCDEFGFIFKKEVF